MKKTLLTLCFAALVASCSNAVDTQDAQDGAMGGTEYTVDASASSLQWYGHKPFVENYGHGGAVQIQEGVVGISEGVLVSGSFILDMKTIVCTDEALPQEKRDYLAGHLMSQDFFAVDSFATASFEITQVDAAEGTYSHHISGNLTLRGVSKNIAFDANVTVSDSLVQLTSPRFSIDRKEWGVMYASTSILDLEKDNLISDDLGITLNIVAKK